MDLADDGIAGDADFGGDLAARQTVDDAGAELFDALRRPGSDSGTMGHVSGLANAAAVLGRADRAKAGATGGLLGRATARREFDGRERAGGRDHRAAFAPKRLPARRF